MKWAQLGDEAVVPPHECGSVQGLRSNVGTVLEHFPIPGVLTPSPEVVLGHCPNSGPKVVLERC